MALKTVAEEAARAFVETEQLIMREVPRGVAFRSRRPLLAFRRWLDNMRAMSKAIDNLQAVQQGRCQAAYLTAAILTRA